MNQNVSVGITTFYRPKAIEKALKSLEGKGFKKIYVADQGGKKEEKEKIYQEYKEKIPLEVLDLEYDAGLAYSRNKILEKVDTPYFLLMDDDHQVNDIQPLKDVLEHDDEIGAVAGVTIQNKKPMIRGLNLKEKSKTLIKKPGKLENPRYTPKNTKYYLFDIIPNCALFRMKCLEDYSWDDFYVIGSEHVDFYLKHYKMNKWKFAITLNSIYLHNHEGEGIKFTQNRFSNQKLEKSRKYFLEKFDLNRVILKGRLGSYNLSTTEFIREKINRNLPLPLLKIYDSFRKLLIKRLKRE